MPTFGVSTRDGALMAIDEWNAKGGVNGMTIVPIVEDSQCTPDPALNAANKVINQDKVHYIIGEVCSSASIPVSKITTAKKVLQISPTSTNDALTVGADGKVYFGGFGERGYCAGGFGWYDPKTKKHGVSGSRRAATPFSGWPRSKKGV